MRKLVFGLAYLSLIGLAPSVRALSVFRCTDADGAVTFQDQPCPGGAETRIIILPDDPVRATTVAPTTTSRAAVAEGTPLHPEHAPTGPPAVSSGTICVREDGSRYLSESGRGERRAVPLAMLGIPSRSLAEAYAGRDGMGVSAPGLREPPTDASPATRAGALYVWREDPCQRLSGAPLCAFLDSRVVDTERRLRLAFSDSADGIRQELKLLRDASANCRY